MRSVYIKEGPVVFLKSVLLMELVAGLLLFGASFLENYEMLYRSIKLDDYLRYDTFIMLAFSFFQLSYLLFLFLNWYFSYFEIKDDEIIRKSGIIFHTRTSFPLKNIVSVGTFQSPIDRIISHATLNLENKNGHILKLRNIPNYQEYLAILKRSIKNIDGDQKNILDLLRSGENLGVEFKETLRIDSRNNSVSKEIERAALKTIVGFMNSDGGELLIGVNDKANVIGIDRDLNSLPKKNTDGFENHLNSLVRESIGVNAAKNLQVHFQKLENKYVCLINIHPTHRPVYLKSGDKEEFFVRVGNSTRSLSLSETEEYIKSRFN